MMALFTDTYIPGLNELIVAYFNSIRVAYVEVIKKDYTMTSLNNFYLDIVSFSCTIEWVIYDK